MRLSIAKAGCLSLLLAASLPAQRMANTYPSLQSFIDTCPQSDPYYAIIRRDFQILRDGAPAGPIVCTEPYSKMPVAQITEELTIVQMLRFAYYMDMGRSQYLPWTPLRLYDWFKSRVAGFNIDTSLNSGSVAAACCSSINGGLYIIESRISNDLNRAYRQTPDGLAAQVALVAHETRHSEADRYGHVSCCGIPGGCDQSYDERNLSPYGIQYYLAKQWLTGGINLGYSCNAQSTAQLASAFQQLANVYPARFCDAKPARLSLPTDAGGACVAACTFTLSGSTPAPVQGAGGIRTIGVTASDPSCAWTAASGDNWIFPAGERNFTGTGVAAFGVDLNQSGAARAGTVTAAGIESPVKQDSCSPCTPAASINAVVSGAPLVSSIASGSWVTIYGANLSASTRQWQTGDFMGNRMPLSLDGVTVTINGQPAAIYYISPTQLNVQSPDDGVTGAVQVQVGSTQGAAKGTANLQTYAPAFFAIGGKYVAAVHADGTYVGQAALFGPSVKTRPANPGEVVALFGTGFGPTSPSTGAGVVSGGGVPLASLEAMQIRIGGQLATVQFSGLTGPGLYQFNIVVPALPDGDASVVASFTNDFSSEPFVTMSPPGILISIQRQ